MTAARAGAAGLMVLAAAGMSACASTADKSAAIARAGRVAVKAAGRLDARRRNREVRVARAVVIRGSGGAVAAAVQLRNVGGRAQRDVPVLIDVHDARGASVYRNDTVGLQPALQRLTLIRGHRSAWWVNDQVTASAAPRSLTVRVGSAPLAGRAPKVTVAGVHLEGDATGRSLTGTVVNGSRTALRDVLIFGVALRSRRVVAAGRALVPKLPAAGAPRPTHFRLFFIGDPRGARVALTVAPPAAPS